MARATYVYDPETKCMVEKGDFYNARIAGPLIIGDIQPFRSTVDGSLITGRASLREHNRRNDVVQTADLQGLPPKLSVNAPKSNRAEIKSQVINVMRQKGML